MKGQAQVDVPLGIVLVEFDRDAILIGGRIVARETVKAFRKDVLAKC